MVKKDGQTISGNRLQVLASFATSGNQDILVREDKDNGAFVMLHTVSGVQVAIPDSPKPLKAKTAREIGSQLGVDLGKLAETTDVQDAIATLRESDFISRRGAAEKTAYNGEDRRIRSGEDEAIATATAQVATIVAGNAVPEVLSRKDRAQAIAAEKTAGIMGNIAHGERTH